MSIGFRFLSGCMVVPLIVVTLVFSIAPSGHAQEQTQLAIEEIVSDPTTAIDEETTTPNDSDAAAIQFWLIVVAVIASVTALVAVAVSFYLYRWRRLLLADHSSVLMPEEWGAVLRENSKATRDLITTNSQRTQIVTEFLNQHSGAVHRMTETFMTFKRSLDEKDLEIERLRQGYDAYVYRRFLHRFIRVHQSLLDYASGAEVSISDIRNLTILLADAMEESGVVQFEPEIGDDVRDLGDRVGENIKILDTADPAAHLTIAEVNTPGYLIESGEQSVVLIPAQVTVYQSSNLGGEE